MNDVGPDEEDHITSNRASESEERIENLGIHFAASTPPNCTGHRNMCPSDGSTLAAPNTTKHFIESGRDPQTNDSAQLCHSMKFILKKAGVRNKPKIDVTRMLKVQSSDFIDRIIKRLQQYGTSSD